MSGVQSIERAFSLLRVLSMGPMGVTELAERTELAKSTVSRLLSALESEGAVVQVESGGEYTIGTGLVELAAGVGPDASFGAILHPFLLELAAQTSGSAGFTVREGDVLLWAENVDPDGEVVHVSDLTGQTFPLHAVPSGIAVLSTFSSAELEEYLDTKLGGTFEHEEGDAPSDALIRRRVARAREAGLFESLGDLIPDVNAYAVPLFDSTGVVGGLYVQGPSFRFPEEGRSEAVRALLLEIAEQVNDRLSHR